MNYNYFFLSILLSFSFINCQKTTKLASTKEECNMANKGKFNCFCSVDCAPREMRDAAEANAKPDPNRPAEAMGGDDPQFVEDDTHMFKDRPIKCYCKPWDRKNVDHCANKLS